MEDEERHKGGKPGKHQDIKFSPLSKGRSTLEKCLIVVAVVLFITTIIFLGLFIWFYNRYNETAVDVCESRDCVKAAALMANKMNESADPCKDFHEYACGRYNRDTVMPEGKIQTGSLYAINDGNQLVMKAILTEAVTPEQPVYLQNMKRFYKSCVDEDQIEKIGLQPYLSGTAFVRDWPTLYPAWDAGSFNLNDALVRYAAVDIFPLFAPGVLTDFTNSSKRSLFLAQGDFGLPRDYLIREETDPVPVAYRKYLTEFAVTLGANRTVAEQDMTELMRLLTALSKILPTREDAGNHQKMYNPMTIKKLSTLYPDIDIPRTLKTTFAIANMTLAADDIVINIAPKYFGNLSLVLNTFSNRTVQNLFGLKYAQTRVKGLTKALKAIRLEFDKVYLGQTTESPRWLTCVSKVSNTFVMGMAKQFVERTFPAQAKVYAEDMVSNLMSAFTNILLETTWMGQATKEKALEKLAAMRRKVGYPDVDFSDDDITRKYQNYVMNETDYFSNLMLSDRLAGSENKRSLLEPVDKSEWLSAPQELNARYSLSGNEILMHAAILQLPVFSATFQDSMNYGAIGVVIGHEITHGFDSSGSQFDKSGNLANWWQQSDRLVFQEKIKCLVDQYSAFPISDINMNVNGVLTQGENIADNGGLKESYRAYKELVEKKGESPTLPGLGLSQDQLFFLAFGQMWCEKVTRQGMVNLAKTDTHSPGKYRIIGALQNSEDFSRAFNCPRGSYMNPEKKCSVW